MERVFIKTLQAGNTFDLGSISLTEKEIMDFAEFFDPLDFHTNKEAAEKSIFKGLVSSGPHVFNVFYKTRWLSLFKESIMAGLEINNWKFLKPIYANMNVNCKTEVLAMNVQKRDSIAITWHFDFINDKGEFLQTLDMTVLHDMNK
ncbi:MAG TPA: MaoC/PaaZ C-terminal domain-containing protein [Bacteroidia bacterium]|jgi:acyl dehydratase